jgi:ketosteroid isomerase-like protein
MSTPDAAAVARAYHAAWTGKDFDRAAALLADDLTVEVPINEYPTAESFVAALTGFGSMTTSVDLLAEMSSGDEAMVLYDMQVRRLGVLRVAEHFTVRDGKICRIRQIHDTAPVRAAGFAG